MTKFLDYVMYHLGRVLLSLIFIFSAYGKFAKWGETTAYMTSKGLPFAQYLLPVAVTLELLGGILLCINVRTRLAAIVLIAFLLPVTLQMHAFWSFDGPAQQGEQIQFLKNLAILGGLISILGSPRTRGA